MRLCALSRTGELTADEQSQLREHLFHCDACREARREYEQVIDSVLPAIAAESAAGIGTDTETYSWSIEQAEERLLSAIHAAPKSTKGRTSPRSISSLGKRAIGVAAIILLTISAATIGYWSGFHVRRPTPRLLTHASPASIDTGTTAPISTSTKVPVAKQSEADLLAVATLRKRLAHQQSRVFALEHQLDQATEELHEQADVLSEFNSDRDQLNQQVALADTERSELQSKLTAMQTQVQNDPAQFSSLHAEVMVLDSLIDEKNKIIAQDKELLQHDRDIRNLMGARNLYIAEIYDVAKTGNTRKPFGRIFYTRNKSLIFYGFDLDHQRGVKNTSVFQAWGRSDTAHDINLGIFYRDKVSNDRWILRFNDPAALAHLQAVFVTIEPRGGSLKPSTKPMLFSYLRLTPNHP